ncbi:MAG: M48 family metallopeptidase [Pseudomonadota bacterium]
MASPGVEQPFTLQAAYFDGQVAGHTDVSVYVEPAADRLTLREERADRAPLLRATWRLSELRAIRDHGLKQGEVFRIEGNEEARLLIEDGTMAQALRRVAPDLDRVTVKRGTGRKVLLWVAGAVASLVLTLFVILPNLADTMAALIPPAREEAIGQTVVAQIDRMFSGGRGGKFCASSEGLAALDKMTERVAGELDLPYPLKVRVLQNPLVNAFAAPGGHIVFFSALIEKAESPEEVAGVLAHEIGHVAARDPLRITLRAAGSAGLLSMVLGDFAGGTLVLVMSEQLMKASYTREAEAQADEFALDLLAKAELPAKAFADFFDKLKDEYGESSGFVQYFESHPHLSSRADAARAAETLDHDAFRPVLNEEEWKALRDMCGAKG